MTNLSEQTQTDQSQVSAKDFSDASMMFCDNYSLRNSALQNDSNLPSSSENEKPLFSGALNTRVLSTGINLCTTQFTALSDSRHVYIMPRSLNIVFSLESQTSAFDPGGGRTKIILHPGEMSLFSFSDDSNTIGRFERGQRSKSVIIQLRPDMIGETNLLEFVETQTKDSEFSTFGVNAHLNHLCGRLINSDMCGIIECLLVESYVLEIIARTIQATALEYPDQSHAMNGKDRAKMARIRDMLVANPGQDHSLTSLAREVGVSVSSLKIKFRKIYGQSVIAFLQQERMKQASIGMDSEGWTVTQAAHFSGYRHASNFSTAFRRYFGYSPGRKLRS